VTKVYMMGMEFRLTHLS